MDQIVKQKIDSFFTQYKKETYQKGALLLHAEEMPTGVFYLKHGTVKEYALSKEGDEVIVNVFKSPSFFPIGFAINNTPNNYFYEALTDSEVWKAPKEDFVTFLKNDSLVLFDLVSRIYKGLEGLFSRLVYLTSGNAQSRIIAEILIQAKRFGTKNGDVVLLKTTEKELAIQTGITRETISREMKKLKEKNLLSIDTGMITIHSIENLANELLHIS